MRLEPICDMQLSYQGGFSLVKPYGGEEGSGYGQGMDARMAPGFRVSSNGRTIPDDGAMDECCPTPAVW